MLQIARFSRWDGQPINGGGGLPLDYTKDQVLLYSYGLPGVLVAVSGLTTYQPPTHPHWFIFDVQPRGRILPMGGFNIILDTGFWEARVALSYHYKLLKLVLACYRPGATYPRAR
jgi:hypothetical protein